MKVAQEVLGLPAAVLSVALILSPSPATAQQDGVVYDPDSPAGKEYALPLDDARNTGVTDTDPRTSAPAPSSRSGASTGGDSQVPLFGAGVTTAAAKSSGPKRSTGVAAKRPGTANKEAAKAKTSDTAAVNRERTQFERGVAASTGASPMTVGGVIAAAALFLAVAAAATARRARRRRTAESD